MSSIRKHAVIAEYRDVDGIMAAARRVRDAGYTRWDTHTPFPIHGMDGAMGIRATRLPLLVLLAGISGLVAAMAFQWWANAHDYPFSISGKPLFSLPANIPVAFETTILFAAVTTFAGALLMNGLPRLHHPLFRFGDFCRVTDDTFFLVVESEDPLFDDVRTGDLLAATGAVAVDSVETTTAPASVPRGLKIAAVAAVTLSILPFAVAYQMRNTTSDRPRIHLVSDMDWQPKYKPQSASPLFEDGRAMRPQVSGTVAWGELNEDERFHLGRDGEAWVADIPIEIDDELMLRGRERYDVYCSSCHGHDGSGDGIVARRALELKQTTWVPPTSIHAEHVEAQPAGQLYATIANGIRTMPGYATQIEPRDRWAIVLYLRALQRSRDTSADDVPFEIREKLR